MTFRQFYWYNRRKHEKRGREIEKAEICSAKNRKVETPLRKKLKLETPKHEKTIVWNSKTQEGKTDEKTKEAKSCYSELVKRPRTSNLRQTVSSGSELTLRHTHCVFRLDKCKQAAFTFCVVFLLACDPFIWNVYINLYNYNLSCGIAIETEHRVRKLWIKKYLIHMST